MANLYLCREDEWVPVKGGAPIPFAPSAPGTGIGFPGDRPDVLVKPDATNTGPRQATTQTMTAAQAMAAIITAPIEADGRRYLRRVAITGGLLFNQASHTNLVFEDCTIDGAGATYTVRAFWITGDPAPSGEWNEFRFCEIIGGASATVLGSYVRYIRCNIHHGLDIAKPFGPGEFYANFMHDTRHDDGAHCDVFQIVTRTSGLLVHWNTCVGINALDSFSAGGDTANAVLQTGTMTDNIGPVVWNDNWFDGGHFTLRFDTDGMNPSGYTLDYTFRRNKFGRNSRWGPLMWGPTAVDIDDSNVWEDTGLPVE